ncbi:Vacuolar protein sorting-associated protein 18 [Wickerhamiella sorbophila]|uniref:Vacuolar protein sorting-associated protein 18 n=1 Tax=Wickerhamiella sorbophila TaxID=45607 RepID=A0A2T0FDG0_9ASCO|nr:Vacuolar protein sorting-associated protein 18 [Wickerhamiella sorbophila]PRT53043.1 Vacuolar protein sorting-associated protein 18 [Wickerhamiella sorbophila]
MEVVLEQVQLMFSLENIVDVAVANNKLYIAVGAVSVIRIDLSEPTKVKEIQIPRRGESGGSIKAIFTDYSGAHLILVTSTFEHYYLNGDADDFRHLSRLKGLKTSAIGWSPLVNSRSPGVILLGTESGLLYEAEVEPHASESYFKRDVRYLKQVWQCPAGGAFGGIHCGIGQKSIHLIALAGATIYSWRDEMLKNSTLTDVYKHLFTLAPGSRSLGTQTEAGMLQVSPNGERYAVLVPGTLYTAKISEELSGNVIDTPPNAAGLLLSNYHALLADSRSLYAVNIWTEKQVSVSQFPGEISGVYCDRQQQTFWAFSAEGLTEIKLENEESDMWRTFVSNKQFEEALSVVKDQADRRYIYAEMAASELEAGNYREAAAHWGLSDAYIEGITAKLIDLNDVQALVALFTNRLSITRGKAQRIMLSSWIVEFLLQQGDPQPVMAFLRGRKDVFDKDTVFELLQQHGDNDLLLDFANLVKDYGFIVDFYILHDEWSKALKVMRDADVVELVYRHSKVLLAALPQETVETWMLIPNLDPLQLLPALLDQARYFRGDVSKSQVIRFLRYLIFKKNVQEPMVDTALMYAYAQAPGEDELLQFVKDREQSFVYFDSALRLCLNYGKIKTAIHIYTLMDLREEAVELALKHDLLDEAVSIAEQSLENERLSKALWLRIAKMRVAKDGPAGALVLAESGNLSIEELLQLLPDFESLGDFAPNVIRGLEKSSRELKKINEEMTQSLLAGRNMQSQSDDLKKRYVLVEQGEDCQTCHFSLLTRKFYVFPCQHGFHFDCLIKELESTPAGRQIRTIKASSAPAEEQDQKLDEIVSSCCLLCSDSRIDLVDRPLVVDL